MGRAETISPIIDDLRAQIAQGSLRPGQNLPPEQELAAHYKRSRGSIRKILKRLHDAGLVHAIPGKGHFVSGGRISQETPPDVALVMGLNCANWESEIAGVRLHELLAERVAQEGGRLHHLQFPVDDDGRKTLQDIVACPATNIVIVSKPWPTRFAELHFFEQASRIGKRLIVFDAMLPRSPSHTHVFVDWSAGARLLIRHLAGLGHRRFLIASFDGNDWSDERKAAVMAEITSAGLFLIANEPLEQPIPSGRPIDAPTMEAVAARTAAVMAQQGADIIVCVNDKLAQQLVEHHGIPLERVAGFDNSPWAREVGLLSPGVNYPRIAETILGECWSPHPAVHARLIPVSPHLPLHAQRSANTGLPATTPEQRGTT